MQFAGTGNGGHSVLLDGENKTGNSPMELVLIALCGCTAFDVVSILQKKREPFTGVEVSAQAEKAAEPPRVFTEIKLRYQVSGKVARKAVEDAVRLSEEKYCSVAAMLNKTARITYEIQLDHNQ
jgi:putative redox protein